MWVHGELVRAMLRPTPVFEQDLAEAVGDSRAAAWWLATQEDGRRPDAHVLRAPDQLCARYGRLVVPHRRLWDNIEGFETSPWHGALAQLQGQSLYETALIVRSWER